eukprot:m.58517 g.58517  ORF g.58517 m.58517 type:complete len:447 (-) comp13769_c0_seq2:233-1573(-)
MARIVFVVLLAAQSSLISGLDVPLPISDGLVTVNVKASPYNASGNGHLDDTQAIQNALDTAIVTGGLVYLPPGIFRISASLNSSNANGLTLRGAGAVPPGQATQGTQLCVDGNVPFAALSINTSSHVIVTDMTLTSCSNNSFRSRSHPILEIANSFWIKGTNLRIDTANGGILINASNTVTIADTLINNIMAPVGIDIGAVSGGRVDIVQLHRITTNNELASSNQSIVWLHMGQGCNTVRADNVGFINGGIGVRLDSQFPAWSDPGAEPAKPLFLFANDLEIDFPLMDAIQLVQGRTVNMVNSYVQGAKNGSGLWIAPTWTAEVQVSNTRFFGHGKRGIFIQGGTDVVLTGNIIADNSIQTAQKYPAIEMVTPSTRVTLTGNQVGDTDLGPNTQGRTSYGIVVGAGVAKVLVTSNMCCDNAIQGVLVLSNASSNIINSNACSSSTN